MRHNELKGLIILIGLFIIGAYYLFKFLFQTSFILGIVVVVLIIIGVYKLIISKLNKYNQLYTIHIDKKGYERYGNNKLVHRDIAYKNIYKEGYSNGEFTERFSEYDVHHIDGDKRNNSLDNLQIVTREEHKQIHGH